MKKQLRIQFILLILLTIMIMIRFYYLEHGDMNIVIFGAIIYLPYVFLICLYNGVVIELLDRINKKIKFLNYLASALLVLIWFIMSNGIRIHYWALSAMEFFIALLALVVVNVGYFLISNSHE